MSNFDDAINIIKKIVVTEPNSEIEKKFRARGIKSENLYYKKAPKDVKALLKDLKACHIFKISNSLGLLFSMTEPDIPQNRNELKLPFAYTFLDMKFKFEKYTISGLILGYGLEEEKDLIYITFAYSWKGQEGLSEIGIECISLFECLSGEGIDEKGIIFENEEDRKEFGQNLAYLVFNFLDFLNNPDIEYVKKEYNPNERGALERKFNASTSEIVLTGKLKRYCDNISQYVTDVKYARKAHWVRGHWRRFENIIFTHKKGTKTWIYPFIRGFGEALKKEYNLTEIS
jgi:hypothetical protein